jgi:hypothetical protein
VAPMGVGDGRGYCADEKGSIDIQPLV